MYSPTQIEGAIFSDDRGKLQFFNSFDMSEVVRFYEIAPFDTIDIRAWQGHAAEKKWFYCNAGSFMVHLIHVNYMEHPEQNFISERFLLDVKIPTVLEVPCGYVNGFKAMEKDSKLLVFSNFDLDASNKDDFRFPVEQWNVDWNG